MTRPDRGRRGIWLGWTLGASILFGGLGGRCAAAEPPAQSSPEELIDQACAAEVTGQSPVREYLLEGALRIDPDCQRANWLAGRVHVDGSWRSPESAEAAWSGDKLLQEYGRRRELSGADAEARIRLANWCRDNGLADRERVHLIEAARLRPDDPAIMRRLGLHKYQNQWLAEEEIERLRLAEGQRRRAEAKWKPVLAAWREEFDPFDPQSQSRLAERVKEVTDEQAFPVLEEELSEHGEREALAVVAYLDTVRSQAATDSLLRHAVFSEHDTVRSAAADALKKRPKYNYMPWLIHSLAAPLEVTIELPHRGTNYVRQTVTQRGPEYNLTQVHHWSQYDIRMMFEPRLKAAALPAKLPRGVKPGAYVEKDTQKTRLNDRIQETLYLLTGEAYETPDQWWDWWRSYTEYERAEKKPVYYRHTASTSWRYLQIGIPKTNRPASSCLAWGTPVATETGMRPVEEIVPGDKVLAQNADTGRIDYQVVLDRTVRRLGEMRKVSLGEDSVTVTLGHPFWVVGQGWRMAKELEVGDRLVCLGGSRAISAMEMLPEDVAYNLIVDGSATYFAGHCRVLLHDNSLPAPTDAVLPGFFPGTVEF